MQAKDKKAKKKKAKPLGQATNTKEIKAALFADYIRRYG